jgi:hypothetical protein
VGDTTQDALNVRIAEKITCTITVKDKDKAVTLGLVTDFATPTVKGGSAVSGFKDITKAGVKATTITFTLVAPVSGKETNIYDAGTSKFKATQNEMSVQAYLKGGTTALVTGKLTFKVFGTPTRACKIISCTGADNGKSVTQITGGKIATCLIAVKDDSANGFVTGQVADFDTATTVGGKQISKPKVPTNPTDGSQMEFVVTAPAVGETFSVTGTVLIGGNKLAFTEGAYAMTVLGVPDKESTMSCVGATTPGAYLRVNEDAK